MIIFIRYYMCSCFSNLWSTLIHTKHHKIKFWDNKIVRQILSYNLFMLVLSQLYIYTLFARYSCFVFLNKVKYNCVHAKRVFNTLLYLNKAKKWSIKWTSTKISLFDQTCLLKTRLLYCFYTYSSTLCIGLFFPLNATWARVRIIKHKIKSPEKE